MNLPNPYPEYNGPECDDFDERAAIQEYDGRLSREEAERAAASVHKLIVSTLGSITLTSPPPTREIPERRDYSRPERFPGIPRNDEVRQCLYSWPELATMDTTSEPTLWDGLLPTNEIALLAGIAGRGKSTLARQLAMAIVSGDEYFLTRKLNTKYRRVLYVSCEDGRVKTARILKRRGLPHEGLRFIFGSQLTLKEIVSEIEKELQRAPVDLVVIDSLGNLFTGEQNSNSDAQSFFRQFAALAEDTLFLFLTHIRKAGHGAPPDQVHVQGAGAFVQRARAVLMLTGNKLETTRYLHLEKENDVSDLFKFDALAIEFNKSAREYSSEGKTIPIAKIGETTASKIQWNDIFREDTELSTGEIVKRLGTPERTAKRNIKDATLSGELVPARRGYYRLPGQSVNDATNGTTGTNGTFEFGQENSSLPDALLG